MTTSPLDLTSAASGAGPDSSSTAPQSYATEDSSWFESFEVGQRWKHFRGATIDEVENQLITKLVMNTAQEHWNEDAMSDSQWGKSRLVFGLITGSLTLGLASQDTAENALAEIGLAAIRFRAGVFHGDTIYAYTEVLAAESADREDAGIVEFAHWGATAEGRIVFECRRKVLIKRRSHWHH
ncbi:MaoC family dehydratase [Rhodococcus sp. LB1]|uniref:MaoC family dehydratase n=1 Tax=Rhodococcus sp. LB1 TaxID=1807499 RepID=UPI000779F4A1|nr:MaoC family dehydratase [Rhodococcus sp. LB1]KXX59560.1 acyl dehydratase [Rhodococcus sp. LB1]